MSTQPQNRSTRRRTGGRSSGPAHPEATTGTRRPTLDRTVEGVVLVWDGPLAGLGRAGALAIRRRVERLVGLGVHVVVVSDLDVADLDARLGARPSGPGSLVLVTAAGAAASMVARDGPRPLRGRPRPDGGLPASAPPGPAGVEVAQRLLARRGVGPGLTLVAATAATTDGADELGEVVELGEEVVTTLRLLDEQLRRRLHRRVPSVDEDPRWAVVTDTADDVGRRVSDALFTLSDGRLATRGAEPDSATDSARLVLAAGTYTGHGSDQHLLPGPWWPATWVSPAGPPHERRVLDLRAGVLLRERPHSAEPGAAPFREVRFASASSGRILAMRAEGPVGSVTLRRPTVPAGSAAPATPDTDPWTRAHDAAGTEIAVLTRDRMTRDRDVRTVERLATYVMRPRDGSEPTATRRLRRAAADGFDTLLARHRRVWARRWETADVEIPGDPDLQLAARFALFHLWGAAAQDRETAVGARGLTGPGYHGHVFWDADVFVLPALVTLSPAAARSVLAYRLARLPRARSAALAAGYEGARFPWESARDGDDVTPRWATSGRTQVPIRTGELEEHVVADVAWAALHYASWTGDTAWLDRLGHPLVVETARYWAARCRTDDDGSVHLDRVMGPDEYHAGVDDNAFTNVMARWNLRRGADLLDARGGDANEASRWRALASRMVDGYDADTGIYEQHRGYFGLEPLTVDTLGRVPVAAELVLPPDRLAGSQLIKQPDVLMLHHLVPDEVVSGSLSANLDFYHRRTVHGSSLSPAVEAGLLARDGRHDEAVELLRTALRIDLDDLTRVTPAGLHLGAQGGAWQALVHGFAGLRVRSGALQIAPSVPPGWGRFSVRVRCLGRRVRLTVDGLHGLLQTDGPLPVWDGATRRVVTGDTGLEPGETAWRVGA